jgi:hypothetical protein
MIKSNLIQIGALLTSIIILFVIAGRNLRRKGKSVNIKTYYDAVSGLSRSFQGRLSKFNRFVNDQPCFIGNFSGYKFLLFYWRVDAATPPSALVLEYRIPSESKMKIFMYPVNPGTVLFAKRIYTGDNDLDKYYIYSNRPSQAERYFDDMTKRSIVKQVIADGWRPPMINSNSISISSELTSSLDPELIKRTLQNLISLRT